MKFVWNPYGSATADVIPIVEGDDYTGSRRAWIEGIAWWYSSLLFDKKQVVVVVKGTQNGILRKIIRLEAARHQLGLVVPDDARRFVIVWSSFGPGANRPISPPFYLAKQDL